MMRSRLLGALAAAAAAVLAYGAYVPSKNLPSLSVSDYIPPGLDTSANDVSSYFQSAASDGCAISPGGVMIAIPAGTYLAHDINNACGNLWVGAGVGGVGSSNQTPTASIVPGNTTIKYSAASAFFMRWQVPGFPAFASGAHINGGGIRGVTLIDGVSTAAALVSLGTQDWAAEHVVMNGAYDGVYMKGVEFPVTSHISQYGTRHRNYEIVGDLSGRTVSGAACTTSSGDCSTRNDVWYGDHLSNIDNLQTNTIFTVTGFVATTTLDHTTGEGPAYGIVVTCPAGLAANASQCPAFGRFNDVQIENFKYEGVVLQDFNDFHFDHLYVVGDAHVDAIHGLAAFSQNYNPPGLPVGRLMVVNSQVFATGDDCVYLAGTMWDVVFINSQIYGCNTGNGAGSGILSLGTLTHLSVLSNAIGTVDAYGGAFPLHACVSVSGTTTKVFVSLNFFGNCTVGYTANGFSPAENVVVNNIGPP